MKYKLIILFVLLSSVLLYGCSETSNDCNEADFSIVNQVDISENPYAFIDASSMKISEIEDPLNNEQTAEVLNKRFDYVF